MTISLETLLKLSVSALFCIFTFSFSFSIFHLVSLSPSDHFIFAFPLRAMFLQKAIKYLISLSYFLGHSEPLCLFTTIKANVTNVFLVAKNSRLVSVITLQDLSTTHDVIYHFPSWNSFPYDCYDISNSWFSSFIFQRESIIHL